MKIFKAALILSAFAAMLAFTGCTACDNTTTEPSETPSVSSSMPSSVAPPSFEGSVIPSEPSGSMGSSPSSSMSSSSSAVDTESSLVPTLSTDFAEIGALSGNPVTWGPGRQMDDENRPTACIGLQEQYGKYNCFFIGNEPGKVYLTFDEGYENGYTAQILDVLKDKNVQAIFFVTMPYVKTQPELVQRMIDEGHLVGNHSDKHPAGGYPTLPLDAVQKDLMSLHAYVKETFDYDMSVFRYPEGAFSEQTAALIGKTGYRQLFWSFAYKDYDVNSQPDPATALERIVGAAHDGAIYLLHAVSKTNTDILPQVIDGIRAKGFEVARFEESIVPSPDDQAEEGASSSSSSASAGS